jgi:hypothetical protein
MLKTFKHLLAIDWFQGWGFRIHTPTSCCMPLHAILDVPPKLAMLSTKSGASAQMAKMTSKNIVCKHCQLRTPADQHPRVILSGSACET